MARRNHRAVSWLHDWHLGGLRQDIRQPALVNGIEMLHDDERHAGISRHLRKQKIQCFKTAR